MAISRLDQLPTAVLSAIESVKDVLGFLVLTGSRAICPTNLDEYSDWDFVCYHPETDRLHGHLELLGFVWTSETDDDSEYANSESLFETFRYGWKDDPNSVNLIVCKTVSYFHRWIVATQVCRGLQLTSRPQRVFMFSLICDGRTVDLTSIPRLTVGLPSVDDIGMIQAMESMEMHMTPTVKVVNGGEINTDEDFDRTELTTAAFDTPTALLACYDCVKAKYYPADLFAFAVNEAKRQLLLYHSRASRNLVRHDITELGGSIVLNGEE